MITLNNIKTIDLEVLILVLKNYLKYLKGLDISEKNSIRKSILKSQLQKFEENQLDTSFLKLEVHNALIIYSSIFYFLSGVEKYTLKPIFIKQLTDQSNHILKQLKKLKSI